MHAVGIGETTLRWQYDSRRGAVAIEVPEPGLLISILVGALALLGASGLGGRRIRCE